MDKYSKNGRTLIVRFTCRRCGYQQDEPYEKIRCEDENDYINDYKNFAVPAGWESNAWYGAILCPGCKEKLVRFMEGKDG